MTSTEQDLPKRDQLPALRAAQTPVGIVRLFRLLVAFLIVLPFLLLGVPWQQNVRGEGRVSAYAPLERRQSVEAPIDGRITQWWIREGSLVKAGDPLFEITDNDPQLIQRIREQLAAAEAQQRAAEAQVKSYQEQKAAFTEAQRLALTAAAERVRMAEQRVTAATRAVEAADIQKITAKLNYDRQKELRDDGLASVRGYELARLEHLRATAELARTQAALAAAHSEKTALESLQGQTQAEFDAKIRSVAASEQGAASKVASGRAKVLELQVKLARQETQRVTAPAAGTIFRLTANQGGEMVKAGDPVVTIIPDTVAMAVELWVDGNDMPLLSEGRKVRVQFEGWPAVQFAGWPSVAVGTFGGVVSLIDQTDDGTGKFRVLIRPDEDDAEWPSRRFLRQGVQARGWILLENVTIGFELWRQINGFPPVIADAEPAGGKEKNK